MRFPLLVTEQGEVERVLVDELRMGLDGVLVHPQDDGVEAAELGHAIPERAPLQGAPRGVVLPVEVRHNLTSLERGKPEGPLRDRRGLEVGGSVSFPELSVGLSHGLPRAAQPQALPVEEG